LYKYDLDIEHWDETMLILGIEFDNPFALSSGKSLDSLGLTIKNQSYFKSQESGLTIKDEDIESIKSF